MALALTVKYEELVEIGNFKLLVRKFGTNKVTLIIFADKHILITRPEPKKFKRKKLIIMKKVESDVK